MRAASLIASSLIALATSLAHAGPAARAGMTFAVADQGAPEQHQVGPMLALGIPFGRFVVEADYAYLSFMDPYTVDGGVHRFGVNLRADIYRGADTCFGQLGCSKGFGLFAQVGAGVRYGQWHIDAHTTSPAYSRRQRELHLGFGLELDNRILPSRIGWQLGLRIAAAPRDDLMLACRGTGCPAGAPTNETGNIDLAVFVEWMFIIGR